MRRFFDTNVLVYARDDRYPGKRDLARSLIADSMEEDAFVVSTQVLVEFYSAVTRLRLLAPAEARVLLSLWSDHDVVTQTPDLVMRAIALHQDHSLSFWDGLIVQAALDARCDILFSEDLQHGRRFGELEIRNPFTTAAHEPRAAGHGERRSGKRRRVSPA